MPDLTTHFIFGRKVLDHVAPEVLQLAQYQQAAFDYGAQGPDILYFRKSIVGIVRLAGQGNLLHDKNITETFSFMKRYIRKKEGTAEHEVLAAYYLGFICHYYLDKTVHPYVYYLQGEIKKRRPKRSAHAIHARIEAELDSIFYEIFYRKPVTMFPLQKYLQLSHAKKTILAKMLQALLRQVYGQDVRLDEIVKCFDDFVTISKLMYDHVGLFSSVYTAVGKHSFAAQNLTNHVKHKLILTDTANFNERVWYHPEDTSIRCNKSVVTLFNEAKVRARAVLDQEHVTMRYSSEISFPTSRNFCGSRNHSGKSATNI